MAIEVNVFLLACAGGLSHRLAFGNQNLSANDIDAGHFLSDRVFDLNAWVHLDEVERARIHIHEELNGSGTFVIGVAGDLEPQIVDLGALRVRKIWGRGTLHNFLVSALYRAIAFIKVQQRAVLITKNLNLNVACFQDQLFEIAFTIPERGNRFAAAFFDFGF